MPKGRRAIGLLAAAVTLVLIAGGAQTAPAKVGITIIYPHHTARWTDADVKLAAWVADRHWPGAPCQGKEQLAWVNDDQAAELGTELNVSEKFAGLAYSDGSCRIAVDHQALEASNPTPDYLCAVIEHEDGHLLGLDHSPDSHNVMYGDLVDEEWVPDDCARAFPPKRMCRYVPANTPVTVTNAVIKAC